MDVEWGMAVALSDQARQGGDAEWAEGHPAFAGKYVVERVLGQGGMGTVFRARHLRLGHRVAIKVLGSDLRGSEELVGRFDREARAASALSSPHAVRIFDVDATDDGTPFMVMELLQGRDLAQVLIDDGPLPIGRAVRFVIEACDAVAEAHRLGIVHRDLKPSNLFLCEDEEGLHVKVVDFGIAKGSTLQDAVRTQTLAPLGTPQYMSPEQVRCAKEVDARSDIWSIGVTLYELLTGVTPFPHDTAWACIAAIAADPVPDPRERRPDLPAVLVAVLKRALAKERDERFGSVEALVLALAPFADLSAAERVTPRSAARAPQVVSLRGVPKSHARFPAGATSGSDPAADTVGEETNSVAVAAVVRDAAPGDRARRGLRARLAGVAAVAMAAAAFVVVPRCVGLGGAGGEAAGAKAESVEPPSAVVVPAAVTLAAPILVDDLEEAPDAGAGFAAGAAVVRTAIVGAVPVATAAAGTSSSRPTQGARPGASATRAHAAGSSLERAVPGGSVARTAPPAPPPSLTAGLASGAPLRTAVDGARARRDHNERPAIASAPRANVHGGLSGPGF